MIRETKTAQAESRGNLLTMPRRRLFSPFVRKGMRLFNGEMAHCKITTQITNQFLYFRLNLYSASS